MINRPAPTVNRIELTNGLRKRTRFRLTPAPCRTTDRTSSCDWRKLFNASSFDACAAGRTFFGARPFPLGGGSSMLMKTRLSQPGSIVAHMAFGAGFALDNAAHKAA